MMQPQAESILLGTLVGELGTLGPESSFVPHLLCDLSCPLRAHSEPSFLRFHGGHVRPTGSRISSLNIFVSMRHSRQGQLHIRTAGKRTAMGSPSSQVA